MLEQHSNYDGVGRQNLCPTGILSGYFSLIRAASALRFSVKFDFFVVVQEFIKQVNVVFARIQPKAASSDRGQ